MSYFDNNVEKSLKIVGGQEATPHSWPSIVFLKFLHKFDVIINGVEYTDFREFSCGGTIISKNEIITAAQ